MGVFLRCGDLGNAHICKLKVGEGKIPHNFELLSRFDLVGENFNQLLHVVRCLNHILILHDLSGRDLPVANLGPIHELYKHLVCVSHDKVFRALQSLVVNCRYHDFLQVAVHVLDQMVIMDIILVFLVRDDDVAVRRIDRIGWHATRFSWMDECDLGV